MTRQEIETCVCGTATVSTVCFKYQNVTKIQFKHSNKTTKKRYLSYIYIYQKLKLIEKTITQSMSNVKCLLKFHSKNSLLFFFLNHSTTKQTKPNNNNKTIHKFYYIVETFYQNLREIPFKIITKQ